MSCLIYSISITLIAMCYRTLFPMIYTIALPNRPIEFMNMNDIDYNIAGLCSAILSI